MTRAFLSTWGQNDNLGDSVLRRGLVTAFQASKSTELHVFIGDNDDDYLTALGLRGDEVLYRDRQRWWLAGMAGMARERTILAQTAGELFIGKGTHFAGWRTLAGARMAKLRGGTAIQVGAGVRFPQRPIPTLERSARSSMGFVAWRDAPTRDAFAVGSVAPDLAFGEGSAPESWAGSSALRDRMAVTLRGDREAPTSGAVRKIRAFADEHGLEPLVLTQVRRDSARARALADALGVGEPLLWSGESHSEWEERVRDVYRRSRWVVGDRAHALIIGATEGAIPLAWSGQTIEKLTRIMAPAGIDLPASIDEESLGPYVSDMTSTSSAMSTRMSSARAKVHEVLGRIREISDGGL